MITETPGALESEPLPEGSGAVLSGLVKKIHPEARILQFGSPGDLETILTALS